MGDLQFDRAETAPPPSVSSTGQPVSPGATLPPGVTTCAACGEPIADVYFEANGKIVCPRCRDAVLASQLGGSAVTRLFKAAAFGILAGIVGAAIWFAVRHFSGWTIGLIAVVVGLAVGGAVKAGSEGRGGIGYQILAVLLTYLAIAASWVPTAYMEYKKDSDFADNPVALVIVSIIESMIQPVLGGILGLLITGFALWEAWQINRPNKLAFTGPYRLAPTPA